MPASAALRGKSSAPARAPGSGLGLSSNGRRFYGTDVLREVAAKEARPGASAPESPKAAGPRAGQWRTCFADGVMPCCTTMRALVMFSSCILWQYSLMVLIPTLGSSEKNKKKQKKKIRPGGI